jgi:virulence-associated protein VapD
LGTFLEVLKEPKTYIILLGLQLKSLNSSYIDWKLTETDFSILLNLSIFLSMLGSVLSNEATFKKMNNVTCNKRVTVEIRALSYLCELVGKTVTF